MSIDYDYIVIILLLSLTQGVFYTTEIDRNEQTPISRYNHTPTNHNESLQIQLKVIVKCYKMLKQIEYEISVHME